MKRRNGTITNLSLHNNELIVDMQGYFFRYFIKRTQVNWYPLDKDGNSIKGVITAGTVIEFDDEINPKTRNLQNVIICKV